MVLISSEAYQALSQLANKSVTSATALCHSATVGPGLLAGPQNGKESKVIYTKPVCLFILRDSGL